MTAPTPRPSAQSAAVSTYQAQQEQLRAQLATAILAIWAGMAVMPSPGSIESLIRAMLPISLGAQRAMAALTQAQLNQMVRPPRRIIIPPALVTGEALRGRDPKEVYERAFAVIRRQLDAGKTMGEAIASGQRRALDLVSTDVQLAHTHTAQRFIEAASEQRGARTIVGYRRQLSSKPNHCALCVLASTRRYHRGSLMPIHPNCGCTVVPIYEGEPAGTTINADLVAQVHEIVRRDLGEKYVSSGSRFGDPAYSDIIITNDHGELGPVMGVRGHAFRKLGDPRHLGHIRVNPKDDERPDDVVPQDLDNL